MDSIARNKPETQPKTPAYHRLIGALLGWLGALNLLLLTLFILATYLPLSPVPPMDQQSTPVLLGATVTIASGAGLILGSTWVWRYRLLRGGLMNLGWGLLPVPVYVYFACFSVPTLLDWLGPLGPFLLAPAIASGLVCIIAPKHA